MRPFDLRHHAIAVQHEGQGNALVPLAIEAVAVVHNDAGEGTLHGIHAKAHPITFDAHTVHGNAGHVLIQAIQLAGAVLIEMDGDAQIEDALVQRACPGAL